MKFFTKNHGIHRLLVSGSEAQLFRFNMIMAYFLNAIDGYGQTIRYTCPSECFEAAIETAKLAGVTLQEIHCSNGKEVYPLVVKGDHPGWSLRGKSK